MASTTQVRHRFDRDLAPSVVPWNKPLAPSARDLPENVAVECGWGRLLFAHTFHDHAKLAQSLCEEQPGKRDIAIYLRDPHVVLSLAPQQLFLDPSNTYRLWFDRYRPASSSQRAIGFFIRRARDETDARAMNRLYRTRNMVPVDEDFVVARRGSRVLTHLVAEDASSGEIIGTVTGVDHHRAFADPERGSSLWCLAVDPQAGPPAVGEVLVRYLAEHFQARGACHMDLSVLHDNQNAIRLYEKLGFQRIPVFCLKHKNSINERLFIGPGPEAALNPYATIIVDEARRRGIHVEVLDSEANIVALSHGGRTIRCRESLSELTSAVAVAICDDKRLCRRVLERTGLHVPDQIVAGASAENEAFMQRHRSIVVKPARGEQGHGISVGVRKLDELELAIGRARQHDSCVLLEQCVSGVDLRIVVIGYEVVAAAIRRPAQIFGTGRHTVRELIDAQSRRRMAATGGESRIPMDEETARCVYEAGFDMDAVLPAEAMLVVRKTANLHTGGTIHDVTPRLSSVLAEAAVLAARAIEIPTVGLDFIVPKVEGSEYVIIEANERPGLANHEPRPTAERFIDLLFPHSAAPG